MIYFVGYDEQGTLQVESREDDLLEDGRAWNPPIQEVDILKMLPYQANFKGSDRRRDN